MRDAVEVPAHPFAAIFPLMEGVAFRELVEDIRVHGLHEPIMLFDGAILDGRNRYRACQAAQVPTRFETYRGEDALAFVVSVNLRRRHLDVSQRAMIAAEIANFQIQQAPGRGRPRKDGRRGSTGRLLEPLKSPGHGKVKFPADGRISGLPDPVAGKLMTLQSAAALMNVSEPSIRDAKHILLKGSPTLIAAVKAGDASVGSGKEFANLPKAQQDRIIRSGGPSSVKVLGRVARDDRLTKQRLNRAATAATAVAVFDHVKIGDGRSIGNVRKGEIARLVESLLIVVDALVAVDRHGRAAHDTRVRDLVTENTLARMLAEATKKHAKSKAG